MAGTDIEPRLAEFDISDTPSMTIGDDGRASGFGGVNRWFGSVNLREVGSGIFEFGPVGSTMMAGPPAAMALERDFLSALDAVQAFDPRALDTDTLRLLSASGGELLLFSRR
jgi:heat shock protein HslJ